MNVLRRFWNWLIKKYYERNEPKFEVIVARAPASPEPPTPGRIHPKPRKLIHQNYGNSLKVKEHVPVILIVEV